MSTGRQEKPAPLEELYGQNDFIDAKDNQGDWRVGYIVGKYETTRVFKVRFDGWPSKYDQNYKFNSLKLKPFRSVVVGYTGQMQNPGIREWKFTQPQHEEKTKQLQAFLTDVSSHSPHQINQLLRGHNYIYLDFLMTWKFATADGLRYALEYFLNNIKFLALFLQQVSTNLLEFLKAQTADSDPNTLTSREAYLRSYFQLFDGGFIITGSYPRLGGFFRDNGELLRECLQEGAKRDPKRAYQTYIVGHFVQLGGMQAIEEILQQLLQINELVPFLFLHSLTSLYNGLSPLLTTADRETVITKIIKIGEANLQYLKQYHLKDLHKHHVSNFLAAVVTAAVGTALHQGIAQWSVKLELALALKMIGCPYFQQKLKGIGHIQATLQKQQWALKGDWFQQWMQANKLLNLLFTNDNQEFIRKACELVKFLNIKCIITDQNIDFIWQARVGKHETSVKEIYTLVAELPLYQTEHIKKLELFAKVNNLPEAAWDQDYIKFIKEFSQNSYGVDIKQKLDQAYGFDMVYRYALRQQSEGALTLLTSLLHKVEKSKLFFSFQEGCFESIKDGKQAEIHLKLLLTLCSSRLQSFEKLHIDMIGTLVTFILSNGNSNNTRLISDTLQLLAEVVKSSSKEVQTQQLMALWRALTPSPHREALMRWIFKRRESGRVILNQVLNQAHRSYLLEQLWNTQQEAANMDELQAALLVQLVKSVNTFKQKMKRLNVVVRPLSLQLDGYEKLWSVLRHCEKSGVIEAVCQLLAQLAACFQEGQDQRIAIENLVQNIAQMIRESLQVQDISLIRKLLLLTDKLIARDQEVFPPCPQPKITYLREFTVVHMNSKEEKTHKFNCMAAFYEFKKMLAEKWAVPLHRLQVFNNKHEPIRLEQYFKSMSQNQFTANYRFEITQAEAQESIVQQSLNKELDLFFLLLDDKRIEKQVWSIVERLPISDDLKFRILDTQDILEEMQKVGFYKELYQLKVMLELGEQWWSRFTTSHNLALLIRSLSKAAFTTHIELEYLTTITAILAKMLGLSSLHDLPLEPSSNLFSTSLSLLRLFLTHLAQNGSHSLSLQLKLIRHLFQMAESLRTCLPEQDFLLQLLSKAETEQLLTLGLIQAPHLQLRRKFSEQLRTLLSDCQASHWPLLLELLLKRLLKTVVSLDKRQQLKEYFEFTSVCLERVPQKHLFAFIQVQGQQLCTYIFGLAQNEQAESVNGPPNMALVGYLGLLRYLAPLQNGTVQSQIGEFVLKDCLFSEGDCRCKSKKARWEALSLLKSLFVNPAIIKTSCSLLGQLHKNGKWRTRRVDDWVITLQDKMKSPTGYVGLKNLGCICYMNSFIQQLFMMPYFRNRALAARDPTFHSSQTSEDVLFQLQKMFLNLQLSEKKFYNPKDFCHAFKDYEGNPTNVSEQMDIDEFSGILFDRLQNQLKPTREHSLIKDMFGGVFSNQIVCKGCPHYSETEEQFLSLSLTVKNKKNIYQSLDTMIKGDTLDGDNAYFCERCNKKVSAVKRVSLKQLPDYLIVTLKRFEFDYARMIKLKVNEYCEFPHNLNLKEYSRQWLRQQEGHKQEEDQLQSPEYYSYVLKGVVVHMGYADSGHYYSYIQDRLSGKWFQFNDTIVRDFSPDDLPQECFGGQYGGYEAKQKIKNAYMLIYQRQKKSQIPISPQHAQQSQAELAQIVVKQEIQAENRQHKIQNILFSGQYSRFINQMVDGLEQYEPQSQKKALKFAIITFLTVTLREKTDTEIHNKLRRLQVQLDRIPELKEWVLSLMSQPAVFEEFFRNNLIRQTKKILSYWIADLFHHCPRQAQELFCNLLLTRLTQENDNVLEYCLMLYEVALSSPRTLDYLNSKHIVGRFIQNIVRKQPRIFNEPLELLPEAESEIGKQVIIERTPQQMAAKKLKLENENGFIWGLINLIIARAREKGGELEGYLSRVQAQYLWLPDTKIYKILQQIRSKHQLYEYLNLLAFLSTSNKDFLGTLLGFICNGLKEFQSKRYRQFFLLFEKLINVQDHLKALRLGGFSKIIQATVHNQQYSLDLNIIQQWIVILLNRNQILRTYLANDQHTFAYLFKIATKKPPSDEIARKNGAFGEWMINKLHGVKFPRTKKAYVKMGEDIADFYQQLIENRFVQSPHWPSVFETEGRELKVGEPVAYFDAKQKIDYEQGKVESVFLGRVELSLKRNRTIHIWKDDQKLTLNVKLVPPDEQHDLNSSRTTQMDIDDDQDAFEELI